MLVDHFSIIPDFPLAAHIHREPAQLKLQRTKCFLQNIFVHVLHETHASSPIPVRGVPFHGDMLWQMLIGIILIAKTRSEVVNLLEPSTNQSLQRQFVRNA